MLGKYPEICTQSLKYLRLTLRRGGMANIDTTGRYLFS